MPVTFSDSDWERLSYDEDSQPPSFDPDLEAGSGKITTSRNFFRRIYCIARHVVDMVQLHRSTVLLRCYKEESTDHITPFILNIFISCSIWSGLTFRRLLHIKDKL